MQATGIQLDGSVLRWATVKKNYQNLHFIEFKTLSIEDPKVKPLYLKDSGSLVSGLHSSDIMICFHSFAPAKGSKVRQALILQTEAQLHLKSDDLLIVSLINKQEKKATTLSTTKKAVADHLKSLRDLQLDPVRVGAIPSALQAFLQWKAPEISSYFLIDIGCSDSNCMWVENGELHRAHSLPLGMQKLQTAWQEDRKKMIVIKERADIDFSTLKTSQFPTLTEEARIFRREISKILHSFQCQRPLIFTGEIESNGFREYLLDMLRDCISEEMKIGLSADEQRYAVCLGLAIDYLIHRDQPIQFRSADLAPRTWQNLGRNAMVLLGCSIISAGLLYQLSSWWMDKRDAEIVHSLETWTATQDPALRAELFSNGSQTKDLVDQWLKLIEKNAKDYRFLMAAPRVSTFLDFLTHHPLIESFRAAGDPFSFEHIHYQLVSFPRLESLQDPYLAKIEIELKAMSPLDARKFHEMLLQGNGLIDAAHEITWDVMNDRYKVSFYLKN